MTFQLTTDSGADLTPSFIKDWDVKIVSLYVRFGDEQFKSEELTTAAFLERISEGKVFPQSAAPSPQDYYDMFKAIDPDTPILHVSISSGVSASFNHAQMGKNMILEEEPDRQIELIDTKGATSSMILMLKHAHDLREAGKSFNEVATELKEKANYVRTVFILETLDNLIQGGRLDKVKGTVAKTLNLKIILHASTEGKIEALQKVRGTKKASRRFVDLIGEYIEKPSEATLVLTHGNTKERRDAFSKDIQEAYHPKELITAETGPVISAHAGQGAIVVSFFSDKNREEQK